MMPAELLAAPHGRDGLIHALTAMVEWPKLDNGTAHSTKHWIAAGHAVRGANNAKWLVGAIVYVARSLGANVGDEHEDLTYVNVWNEYTPRQHTSKASDRVCCQFDGENGRVELAMNQARVALLALLRMKAGVSHDERYYEVSHE